MLYASVVGVIVCSSFVFVFLFPIFARWQSKYLVAITEENHMRQSLTYCFFFLKRIRKNYFHFTYENMLSALRLTAKIISPPALTRKYKHRNDPISDR